MYCDETLLSLSNRGVVTPLPLAGNTGCAISLLLVLLDLDSDLTLAFPLTIPTGCTIPRPRFELDDDNGSDFTVPCDTALTLLLNATTGCAIPV